MSAPDPAPWLRRHEHLYWAWRAGAVTRAEWEHLEPLYAYFALGRKP